LQVINCVGGFLFLLGFSGVEEDEDEGEDDSLPPLFFTLVSFALQFFVECPFQLRFLSVELPRPDTNFKLRV
jgi:hypothetical protein